MGAKYYPNNYGIDWNLPERTTSRKSRDPLPTYSAKSILTVPQIMGPNE
jgi:hypothetical protein